MITSRESLLRFPLVFFAVVIAALTATALAAFPQWDDAGLIIWLDSDEPDIIVKQLYDRPIFGRIMQSMADWGVLVSGGAALYALTWSATAYVTWRWCRLLGNSQMLAFSATMLALAPIIYQLQFVLINPVISGMLGPVLVHLAALALIASPPGSKALLLRRLLAATLVVLGTLLSEYAIPTVFAAVFLMIALRQADVPRRTTYFNASWLIAAALISYAWYLQLGSQQARVHVRPESQFGSIGALLYKVYVFLPRLLTETWHVAAGQLLSAASEVSLAGKLELTVFFGALIVTTGVWFLYLRRMTPSTDGRGLLRSFILLLGAVMIGLAFPVLMGRQYGGNVAYSTTRYWLPILPFGAGLSAVVLSSLFRSERNAMMSAIFLSSYFLLFDGVATVRQNERLVRFGAALEPYVDERKTLILLHQKSRLAPRNSIDPFDFEMSHFVTSTWPLAKRRNAWVTPAMDNPLSHMAYLDEAPSALEFSRPWHLRSGPVERILYAHFEDQDRFVLFESDSLRTLRWYKLPGARLHGAAPNLK